MGRFARASIEDAAWMIFKEKLTYDDPTHFSSAYIPVTDPRQLCKVYVNGLIQSPDEGHYTIDTPNAQVVFEDTYDSNTQVHMTYKTFGGQL